MFVLKNTFNVVELESHVLNEILNDSYKVIYCVLFYLQCIITK